MMMMSHSYLVSNLAKIRYQQLLQEAEAERLYRQLQTTSPKLAERAGDLLIALGHKLGGHGGPVPRTPALRLK